MLGAALYRRLVFGNPMALTVCLKLGFVVLLVQVFFLFFFNTALTSPYPKSVTSSSLHHSTHHPIALVHYQNNDKPVDDSLHFISQQAPPRYKLKLAGPLASDLRNWRHEVNMPPKDLSHKDSQQLLHQQHNQGQIVNTNFGLRNSQTREVIRDPLSRNQNSQVSTRRSGNPKLAAIQPSVNQQQSPLSKRNTHQQSWQNHANVDYKPILLSKQTTQRFWTTVENTHQKQFFLPQQKSWVSLNNPQNVAQNRQQLLRGTTELVGKQKVHSGNTQLEGEGGKRLSFYVTLLKPREKTVLASGCPQRGVGSHVTSLAFVKVHKSASTTVANVLARYALRHTLNVALPWKKPGSKRFNYFEPKITPNQVMPIAKGQLYQVVFNHMIFHRKDLQPLMPNNTYYFAIMRDPLDRFLSSFIYYGIAQVLIKTFHFPSVKAALMYVMKHPEFLMAMYNKPELYNSLAGDTGLPPAQQKDAHFIKAHIQQLEHELDFLMVVEYFDESLILLKRRACLSMQDIVYAVKNVRPQYSQAAVNLTPQEKAMFENFQIADVIMYRHFYIKFWNLVYAEGPGFFEEVRQFKEIQRTVTAFCRTLESIWDFVTIPSSAWNEEFVVTARECRLMKVSELDMQFYLIDRANKLYNMSKGR